MSTTSAIDEFQEEIRPNGEERVDVVAEKAGTYTLTITAGRRGGRAWCLHDSTRQTSAGDRQSIASCRSRGRYASPPLVSNARPDSTRRARSSSARLSLSEDVARIE